MDPPLPISPHGERRRKRRELDARRSRCRIRLGGHLEQWCQLKDQLGFALHSQLAKFLLDRYSSQGCVVSADPKLLHPAALQRLVALSHTHSRQCGFVPDVKPPTPNSPTPLVWECEAGHRFSWGDPIAPQWGEGPKGGSGSPSGPIRRRSLRRMGVQPMGEEQKGIEPMGEEHNGGKDDADWSAGGGDGAPHGQMEAEPTNPDHERVELEEEEEEEAEADPTYSDDLWDRSYQPEQDSDSEPQRPQIRPHSRKNPIKEEQTPNDPTPNESSLEEKDGRGSYQHPTRPCDEDVAQIGPKRIRKAAKREILLCDFEGCGKIFSNRQYLNHHQKYQHVHQKTFTCSDPGCGKSFNFKKHLKEHEKLHSDKRDYICEFCARSFRTSSNLIIHRRIHTGEKPLQCEICGFTCRQKSSLNWHMRKHGAGANYRFPCELCGKRFEKKDNVAAHKSKSHPQGTQGGVSTPIQVIGAMSTPTQVIEAMSTPTQMTMVAAAQGMGDERPMGDVMSGEEKEASSSL
ncbi:zinc finger protein 692-like isoform X2 [Excalfactoria chinensis]|uniref:zinc finger protein 692-like isoform X2 n=1 Tax=Excalfactoria chinensis TaxID=46218 RepID=UPI003B3A5FD9